MFGDHLPDPVRTNLVHFLVRMHYFKLAFLVHDLQQVLRLVSRICGFLCSSRQVHLLFSEQKGFFRAAQRHLVAFALKHSTRVSFEFLLGDVAAFVVEETVRVASPGNCAQEKSKTNAKSNY